MLHVIDFALDVGRNICHGSDSVHSANNEIALWFKQEHQRQAGVVEHDRSHNFTDLVYEVAAHQ